ncbi:MAG: DegT/DnrJ/EryC1/StrS family aminotransferase [Desulfobacterales bacterium]|nr:DegT/DnrJ/EryC1/StrS family aminotransferase [Desulfobacterales bacterium]
MSSHFIPINKGLISEKYKDEVNIAINKVVESGWFILGEEVKAFEKEFAAYLGAKHCIGVASGTDALILALKAIGLKNGDEVITVSHTAVATIAAINLSGCIPVLIDIDPKTRCIDPNKIRQAISPKTKAILPVHIYGQPCPMDDIISIAKEYGLKIIEDCAQAHGAEYKGKKVGTFGDVSAFSFYPTKNLGAIGDGGAIVTQNKNIAEKIFLLRQYGWKARYISSIQGYNSRLDEIQAAVLRVKLKYLDEDNSYRRMIADKFYYPNIDGVSIIPPAKIEGTLHAMHLFVVECSERKKFMNYMLSCGIGTALHYPQPVHKQPAYVNGAVKMIGNLTVTETFYERHVSLPMYILPVEDAMVIGKALMSYN